MRRTRRRLGAAWHGWKVADANSKGGPCWRRIQYWRKVLQSAWRTHLYDVWMISVFLLSQFSLIMLKGMLAYIYCEGGGRGAPPPTKMNWFGSAEPPLGVAHGFATIGRIKSFGCRKSTHASRYVFIWRLQQTWGWVKMMPLMYCNNYELKSTCLLYWSWQCSLWFKCLQKT